MDGEVRVLRRELASAHARELALNGDAQIRDAKLRSLTEQVTGLTALLGSVMTELSRTRDRLSEMEAAERDRLAATRAATGTGGPQGPGMRHLKSLPVVMFAVAGLALVAHLMRRKAVVLAAGGLVATAGAGLVAVQIVPVPAVSAIPAFPHVPHHKRSQRTVSFTAPAAPEVAPKATAPRRPATAGRSAAVTATPAPPAAAAVPSPSPSLSPSPADSTVAPAPLVTVTVSGRPAGPDRRYWHRHVPVTATGVPVPAGVTAPPVTQSLPASPRPPRHGRRGTDSLTGPSGY